MTSISTSHPRATSLHPGKNNQNCLSHIDAASLNGLLEQQAVQLVDVREPGEYLGEHIPGSILVPLSNFDPAAIPVDESIPTVLYCQTGNRSEQAAQKLALANSHNAVLQLDGGLAAWKRLGYPTQVNPNAPISLMRQVQIVAGALVVTGTVLGAFVSPWFLILSGFVGSGLVFAGVSNTCALGLLLAKMPWNQQL